MGKNSGDIYITVKEKSFFKMLFSLLKPEIPFEVSYKVFIN